MLDIQKQFINYNKSARTGSIKYIVIHSTGNTNDTAQNNHDYFANGSRGASADYFVDDNNIIQIIDSDNYYSWHCGDGHGMYGISNSNSIGIEMCGTNNGNISETTINNTIDLVKYLMNLYGIDSDHVVRHYDASRKSCPSQFMNNNCARWCDFKERVCRASNNTWKEGWNQNSTGWWYSPNPTEKTYYNQGWQYIKDTWYWFNEDGYMRTGWLDTNGHWYYLKDWGGMARNETLEINGKEYKFNDKGEWV